MSNRNGIESYHLGSQLDDQKKAELVRTDPDFIAIKRFNYDLDDLLERYPDGVPDHIIAAALLITEAQVQEMYDGIVLKLRETMKVI